MKYGSYIFFLSFFLFSYSTWAEAGRTKGTVEYVRVHDGAQYPTWEPPIFWFTLNGVTTAGGCAKYEGNVLFIADSPASLSMVLTAYTAGKEIATGYDDASTLNGYCRAGFITMGSPPTLGG